MFCRVFRHGNAHAGEPAPDRRKREHTEEATTMRPRKYTERTLGRAADAYFRRITRTITVQERVDTGELDHYGHRIYAMEDVRNGDGEPVKVRQFVTPPTVGGLCEALGIHRSTWADYCDREKHPELEEVTSRARETIQHYLESELLSREGKDLKGVIFSLQNNYGYSEKQEVELGEKAARAVTAVLPMEERAAILRELSQAFSEGEEHGDEPFGAPAGARRSGSGGESQSKEAE